jgi:hypothetical protein
VIDPHRVDHGEPPGAVGRQLTLKFRRGVNEPARYQVKKGCARHGAKKGAGDGEAGHLSARKVT